MHTTRSAVLSGAALVLGLAAAVATPVGAQPGDEPIPPSPPEPPPQEADSAWWLAATTGETPTADGYRGFEIRVIDGRTRTYPGDWRDDDRLEVIVFETEVLPGGAELQTWYEGRADVTGAEFNVDKLRSAAVSTTIELAGTRCKYEFDDPPPPEPIEPPGPGGEPGNPGRPGEEPPSTGVEPGDPGDPVVVTVDECIDLAPTVFSVEVTWRGRGPIMLNELHDCFPEFDPYYLCVWDRNRNRDARVTGAVDGPIAFELDRSHGVLSRDAHRSRFRLRPV